MPSKYRIIFLAIFTAFFVVTSSAIAIYSLGYEIDVKKMSFDNTIDIRIETKPRSAKVYYRDELIGETPDNFVTSDGKTIPLRIEKNGYITENFTIWSEPNENTSARFDTVYLMPEGYKKVETNNNIEIKTLLSDEYLIFEENGDYYVQLYSFGGLQGNKEEIKKDDEIEILKERWINLLDEVFWNKEQNLILFKQSNWEIFDLKTLPFQTESVIKGYNSNLMLLDKVGNLWLLDLAGKKQEVRFIDSGFDGLTFTDAPDAAWIWQDSKIYKLERNKINEELRMLDLSEYIYTENAFFEKSSLSENYIGDKIIAKTVHQGTLFKTGSKLFYVPDFNTSLIETISENAAVIAVDASSIYWLDSNKQLHFYNLDTKDRDHFNKINLLGDFDDYTVNYFYDWRRLLIYSDDQVFSIWHDRSTLNDSVVDYGENLWINQAFCKPNIYDKSQFCVKDGGLILYQNKALF